MKLAISNIGWSSDIDNQVYDLMLKYGFSGLEIAPTRIFPENPYQKNEEAKEWYMEIFEIYGFCIPSMQSIWYGRQERIFGSDSERKELIAYTKKAVDFASAIECKNIVFGCPRNRSVPDDTDSSVAIDFFREIGEYAFGHGTVIGMEANPSIYNTNYINTTTEAFDLIEKVDSKGFLLNLDIGTMIQNDEKIDSIIGKVHLINHVHVSEPYLKIIEKRDLHSKIKRILTNENYGGFVSIEMGKQGEIGIINDAMSYVKEVFDE